VIGPAIGPCCYVIGAERAQEIRARAGTAYLVDRGDGTFTFDLWAANAAQLAAAGITQIDLAGVCTGHEVARFFSHRAEAGAAGRSLAFIGWRS
jgi:copper oxidase (laccase) domain-containing protein